MNERFVIKGGRPLRGEVEVRGSKNVAPKLMIASLLTEELCIIENVPISTEVDITKELCENIGSRVSFPPNHRCLMETREIKNSIVTKLSRRNRIPILAMGPLLHRKGFAEVPVLGGCPIGHRPINFHIEALNKMGVKVERRENSYYARASHIRGADIEFPYPSVGATENVLFTAVLAQGKTRIKNAALEPEVLNSVEMLLAMGADIKIQADEKVMVVNGVQNLHGVTISTMPDRPEIVSLATAALVTGGDVFIRDVSENYLQVFLQKVEEVGGLFEVKNHGLRFFGRRPYRAAKIETSPHPGFMTDWQQPFAVLLTQAQGKSIIHETVYEDRFGYTKDLNKMGAKVVISKDCPMGDSCRFFGQGFGHTALISGPVPLKGEEIIMTDIRAGMAHIIAALSAEGESVISGIEHIDRGYEKIDERLRALGADIERVQ